MKRSEFLEIAYDCAIKMGASLTEAVRRARLATEVFDDLGPWDPEEEDSK